MVGGDGVIWDSAFDDFQGSEIREKLLRVGGEGGWGGGGGGGGGEGEVWKMLGRN